MNAKIQQKHASTTLAASLAIACVALLALPGCYTRTVESRGLGTQYRGGNKYSPNLKTTNEGGGVLDGAGDFLIGPRKVEPRK